MSSVLDKFDGRKKYFTVLILGAISAVIELLKRFEVME